MKRVLVGVTILGAVAVLAGCPVYSDSGNYRVCDPSTCYDCPDTTYSDACIPWQCSSPADCPSPYTCDPNANQCVYVATAGYEGGPGCASSAECGYGSVCGSDSTCHVGDCATFGCTPGYACWVRGGVATCGAEGVSAPEVDAGWTDSSMGDAADGQANGDAGEGGDSAPLAPTPCNADATCAGGRCLDGVCVEANQLCADSTQCTGAANELCVDGVCTPTCSAASPCAIGYGCDLTRGVCDLNPTTCAATTDCVGGTVCVEAHCVAPCASSDGGGDGEAGAQCPGDEICVHGGCIPEQRASFSCLNDGYSGASANECGSDQVCLHGDCYTSCVADGGGCTAGQECTEVTIAQGTFAVCGTGSNLGSECDPQQARLCPEDGVCIDGHCR